MQEQPGPAPQDRAELPPRINRRRLALLVAVAVAAALVVVIIVVWLTRGDGAPTEKEVSQRLVDAISAASSTSGGDPTGIFDTRQLRTTLEGQLSGWVIDLAASDDRRRVGVSARRLGDFLCVFAWSDVGAPQTATVTDIRLPCFAAMALQAAKNPA